MGGNDIPTAGATNTIAPIIEDPIIDMALANAQTITINATREALTIGRTHRNVHRSGSTKLRRRKIRNDSLNPFLYSIRILSFSWYNITTI